MKLATYKNADGGMEMMNEDSALDEIRALGKVFTAALAERGKASNESDLMAGLAAYTMLDLKGRERTHRCRAQIGHADHHR
jgi:hypothetical protein